MLLSDHDIIQAQSTGEISLTPWTPQMVQPASIDVRLDRFFRVFNNHKHTYVDPAEDQGDLTELLEVEADQPWILHPGEFILGSTYEYVKLGTSIAARLEGKSSLGRLGILTHSTAGFIDPGFEGHITLELSNVSTLPVKLWPGMKVVRCASSSCLAQPSIHTVARITVHTIRDSAAQPLPVLS